MGFTNFIDKQNIPVILDSESKNNLQQNKKEKEKLPKVNYQTTLKAK